MRDDLDKRLADVGELIKSQREVARMSVRRLAELAGVSNPYLSQIERGLRKPSADILQQIAKALQISAESLYERAGFVARKSISPPGAPPLIAMWRETRQGSSSLSQ